MKRIQIAVRDFALPVPRTGSIEVHSGYGYLPQSGDELHRQIQQERGRSNAKYLTEQKISHSFERAGYTFHVAGRIDGLIESAPPLLEEIKTAFDAKLLYEKLRDNPNHPYCLQLKTYGYIYGLQNEVVPACAFLIASYANDRRFELPIVFDRAAYEDWLDRRLDELVEETKERERQRKRRKEAARGVAFPFEQPRAGQLDLIATIERSLATGESLMVQAPTGLGKTVGVMYPMVRDALQRGQRLIYVTPKNSQHQVAEQAIDQLRATSKVPVRSLTLTAKSKLCFKGEPICNPEHCEFAKDYYAKTYEHKLVEKAAESPSMNASVFLELGQAYEVCPFELSVDSIDRADVVIGDYNYVFAPQGLIGRFTGYNPGTNEKPNLVIDEAHNLPARASDYFSPSVSSTSIDACRERVQSLPLDLRSQGSALLHSAFALIASHQPRKREKQCRAQPQQEPFLIMAEQLSHFLNAYLQHNSEPKPGDPIVALCREWTNFSEALEQQGEQFFCTYTADTYGISLKITCCDASEHLASCLKEFEGVVAFSATLKPFDYYMHLSGFTEDKTRTHEFASPFPRQNRKLMIIPQVSTRYSDRSKNYDKIAEAIGRIVGLKPGNYFVFFPSFSFLREVAQRVNLRGFNLLQQKNNMSAAEVQKYFAALNDKSQPTVIFAVQGGVFSEGVDYPGDMLIGALIVGPSLPGFDLERELMREYYEKRFGSGFDYAYVYPAMARVVQAAGRVIRSEEDRGLIVLMDRRFTEPAFSGTMPADWFIENPRELVSASILNDIKCFWDGR